MSKLNDHDDEDHCSWGRGVKVSPVFSVVTRILLPSVTRPPQEPPPARAKHRREHPQQIIWNNSLHNSAATNQTGRSCCSYTWGYKHVMNSIVMPSISSRDEDDRYHFLYHPHPRQDSERPRLLSIISVSIQYTKWKIQIYLDISMNLYFFLSFQINKLKCI